MDKWIFLIPLFPFLGFLVNGLLGRLPGLIQLLLPALRRILQRSILQALP